LASPTGSILQKEDLHLINRIDCRFVAQLTWLIILIFDALSMLQTAPAHWTAFSSNSGATKGVFELRWGMLP
jgi:hypothetical protein